MRTNIEREQSTGDILCTSRISGPSFHAGMKHEIFAEIARQIATEYVKQHQQEILASIDPQAVANLVVAYSGNAVKDMLDKKLPDKVIKETETIVLQKGLFGGVRRII